MDWMTLIIGGGLVLAALGLILAYTLPRKLRTPRALRPIPAMSRLRRALGLAVEDGTRIHISLGKSGMIAPTSAASLAGLSTLERIAQISSISDRPPVATSGDPTLSLLSQDTLRGAYRAVNAPEQYNPQAGRLGGPTPLSYIAGTLPTVRGEQVSANVLVGNFGPEAALLAESADRQGAFHLAATDSLPAQAALYAAAEEPLIGEELYAVPAYLQGGPAHQASLRAQDILRWVICGGLLMGALLKLAGVI